jgi:hypothetical protein
VAGQFRIDVVRAFAQVHERWQHCVSFVFVIPES